MIILTGSRDAGQWQVTSDGAPIGTWHRTENGAALDDTAGERVVVVTNVGASAIVAGCGAERGQWSDIAHKVLAGQCEIATTPAHDYSAEPDEPLTFCGVCELPIFEGDRVENYAGMMSHHGCALATA